MAIKECEVALPPDESETRVRGVARKSVLRPVVNRAPRAQSLAHPTPPPSKRKPARQDEKL